MLASPARVLLVADTHLGLDLPTFDLHRTNQYILLETEIMRQHYDFSKMKGRKNPYTKYLKQPVTIRLDRDTVAYFKSMAEESGIPYQTLINLYLRDCAVHERQLKMKWAS